MTKLTLIISGLLIALGVVTYAIGVDGHHSITALIPAFDGALLLIAGLIALRPAARMHAMHVAVIAGLLGFIAAIGGLIARRPSGVALFSMAMMALLTGVFVLLCVRSFINARKARA